MHTTAMLLHRFTARIKGMTHKIQRLCNLPCSALSANQSIQETLHCQCDAELTERHCSYSASSKGEKSSAQLEFQEDPWGCLSKQTIHNLRGLCSTLVEILIRLACAELRHVRSRTYPPAWFRLRLAHKLEGRYGRRRPKRNAWPVHILAALIFRASFDRSVRGG
jgi:hypothetical protein